MNVFMSFGDLKKFVEQHKCSDDAQLNIIFTEENKEIKEGDCIQIKNEGTEVIVDDKLNEFIYLKV